MRLFHRLPTRKRCNYRKFPPLHCSRKWLNGSVGACLGIEGSSLTSAEFQYFHCGNFVFRKAVFFGHIRSRRRHMKLGRAISFARRAAAVSAPANGPVSIAIEIAGITVRRFVTKE